MTCSAIKITLSLPPLLDRPLHSKTHVNLVQPQAARSNASRQTHVNLFQPWAARSNASRQKFLIFFGLGILFYIGLSNSVSRAMSPTCYSSWKGHIWSVIYNVSGHIWFKSYL